MIKDINKIREELIGFVEVDVPYPFSKNENIKYITMKKDSESFFVGGSFVGLGNNCIMLQNNFRKWSVPTVIFNKKGDISYKSRFFIIDKIEEDKKDKDNETIEFQQDIINKLGDRVQELENENEMLREYINSLK